MSKKTKQLFWLTEQQLDNFYGYKREAQDAWDRFQEIIKAGGKPVAFYSEFSGFSVQDGNTQDPDEIDRLISMEQRAKPYPG
jgi:RecB family exonuclease